MANARNAVIAFGRQTQQGVALAAPKFEIPMGTGHAAPTMNVEELPFTNDSQDPIGHYVSHIASEVALTGLPVLPVSSAALFYAVLGALASSAGPAPFTHDAEADDVLPWWTFWYQEPSGDFYKLPDVKISELTLNWAPGQPLTIDLSGRGSQPTLADTKWGAATVVEAVDPFFTKIGATMKLDIDSTPAATTVTNIEGGSISINRNVEPIPTDGMSDSYQEEQKRDIRVELPELVFENNDQRRTVLTGSPSGTAVSPEPIYGSSEFLFKGSDGAAAATRSLKLALPRLRWATEPLDADPAGSTLRYALAGEASKPASDNVCTATIINADAGAAY